MSRRPKASKWAKGGIALLAVLLLLSPAFFPLSRLNITPDRSPFASSLQQALGLNQPAEGQLPPEFTIIGHRGSDHGIENTRSAIQHGIDSGADWIEVDVVRCQDELILFHDLVIDRWLETLGRTSYEGPREIASLSLAELHRIQKAENPDEQILSLSELFVHFPPERVKQKWVIDVKQPGISEEVTEALSSPALKDRILLLGVSSLLIEYKEAGHPLGYAAGWTEKGNRRQFLFGHDFLLERCRNLGENLQVLALPEIFLNAKLLDEAQQEFPGLQFWTYLGETPESWTKNLQFGVDGLIVDRVEAAASFRNEQTGSSH